jgi:hypothetical protein
MLTRVKLRLSMLKRPLVVFLLLLAATCCHHVSRWFGALSSWLLRRASARLASTPSKKWR